MIELVKTKKINLTTHNAGGSKYTDLIHAPHHIHGTLVDEDLVLCVDNVSQICNESLKKNRRITNCMLKINVNRELGERKTETAQDIINGSKYVCLFGLSLGETDLTWWKYLVEWLQKDKDNRLILFVRDNSGVRRSGSDVVRFRDKERENFKQKSGCTDEVYSKIMNKIIVARNSKVFTYENISIEGTENGKVENADGE